MYLVDLFQHPVKILEKLLKTDMESTIQKKQTKPLSNHGSQIHNGYAWIPQETIHIRKLSQPCELRHDD